MNGGVRAILLDIEGTTTPITFVYQTLFPYARQKLKTYLEAHGRLPEYQTFVDLMDQDSKSTALKDVQGQIWEEGYATGELVGEVFEDVAPALSRWRARGLDVGIFSSGSVLAQKLLFRHSSAGDLTPLLRWHFDTTVGPKTDPESYRRIASSSECRPRASSSYRTSFRSSMPREPPAWRRPCVSGPGTPSRRTVMAIPPIRTFDELR